MQHPPHTASPLTIAKAFRRTTGAHSSIASILLADLLGVLVWVLIGAFIWPPIWWLLRALLHLLHASLLFDLAFLFLLWCIGVAGFREGVLKKSEADAWAVPGMLIFLLVIAVILLWFLKPNWMAIPAPLFSHVPLEAASWRFTFVPQGAAVAVSLSLLAHISILWRAQHDAANKPISFSRAHPDGPIWLLTEQAYALYRQNLTRFHPSPIPHLKTPSTFYYYQKQVNPDVSAPPDPEQEMYWYRGYLVINRGYLGHKDEQADILLPLLARLLYDNNTLDHVVLFLFDLAHIAEGFCLTAWLLAVPLYVQQRCEERWKALEPERVLDRDWFAYACGQGPRLRRFLRRRLEEQTQQQVPDTSVPTLAERIDHLDSLMNREAQQVQQVRDTMSPTPPRPEGNVLDW